MPDIPRKRRNIWAEQSIFMVTKTGRKRRNRMVNKDKTPQSPEKVAARLAQAEASSVLSKTALPLHVIEKPKGCILVVPDLIDGDISIHDRELISFGRSLADDRNFMVLVLALDAKKDINFREAGADRLVRLDINGAYAPDLVMNVIAGLENKFQPDHILFCEGGVVGGDIGRRVAVHLGVGFGSHIVHIRGRNITRRVKNDLKEITQVTPKVLMLEKGVIDSALHHCYEARELPSPKIISESLIKDLGQDHVDPDTIPLNEADFICSAGVGVTDWQAFHEVAKDLGATEGGSRMVCDRGYLPRDFQIGASGTLVDPRCYLAFGISGAPQHLQGIELCKRVVAINIDLHAQMIKRADLSIIADAQDVMVELSKKMKETKNG